MIMYNSIIIAIIIMDIIYSDHNSFFFGNIQLSWELVGRKSSSSAMNSS